MNYDSAAAAAPPPEVPPAEAPPISGSAKSVASEVSHYLQLRLELAKLEAGEAAGHFITLAIIGVVGAIVLAWFYLFLCAGLVYLIAAGTGVSLGWVALAFAAVHLCVAIVMFLVLKARLKNPIFTATVDQLRKDRQWLAQRKETP